jgi:hypothetical protein
MLQRVEVLRKGTLLQSEWIEEGFSCYKLASNFVSVG